MKKLLIINICIALLIAATGSLYAMGPVLTPKERLANADRSIAQLQQQITVQQQALGLPQLLIDTLENAAAHGGHPNMGVEDIAWEIGSYTTSMQDPNDPTQVIGEWKPLQRVNGLLNKDAAHDLLIQELKNNRTLLKQQQKNRSKIREEVADDLVHQKNERFLKGVGACIVALTYAPKLTRVILDCTWQILSDNTRQRISSACKGGLKSSLLHSVYAYYAVQRYDLLIPPLFANIVKTTCYYMLLDLTHKYGSDITEKYISTQKIHDYLRKKITHYDTKKEKLDWAIKVLIAEKADRWIFKLSGQV